MAGLLPRIGSLASGARDAITDVPGVTVGHHTLADGGVQTGVTVVRPHAGDPYRDKVPAAAAVLNGFGKSVGLVQLRELGVLETPIALTNTYSVPAVAQAQIRQCVAANPESGRSLPTVNPLVFECNDGFLNDIQRMAVDEAHYLQAHAGAAPDFAQGAVGAGRGMSCFALKGGIGSASRRAAGAECTVGALVLANFGKLPQLVVAGHRVGERLAAQASPPPAAPADGPEKGSIILLLATDAALDARQLRRLAMRAAAGLARTGSVYGHGSGDIALAFSTAYTVPHLPQRAMPAVAMLHETRLDDLFEAAADACEQAILHALWRAEAVTGRDGHRRESLADLVAGWPSLSTRRA
ncbi:MAG TPA: P1 family peptidase [Ramlibacter sp.]|jgi:D-aminopeptidase|uniref:P1 family peptidase n=1 Tax=Ramlibacter sp. TaxID=1917967 RepID=UPI002D68DA1D|nr:P1 family peptidase [Ramlibacter sp.]HZY18455.1 P1 family peptidase [Ramlibacter sp.]